MPETNPPIEAEAVETSVEPALDLDVSSAGEDPADQIESAEDRLIDAVTATQQEALESLETTREAVLDMLSRARDEISSFVAERVRQDLDAQKALLRCRNIDEIRDVQVRFVRTAMDQYGGQAAQMLRIGGEVAARSFERARA